MNRIQQHISASRLGLILLFLFSALLTAAQGDLVSNLLVEDCNNGLDDDSDGYVDCFDPDCQCFEPPACSTNLPPNVGISIQLAWNTDPYPGTGSVNGIGIVGNLNPQTDNIPEIIAAQSHNSQQPQEIFFFRGDGSNASTPDKLDLIKGSTDMTEPLIGDVDGDGIPELILTEWDSYIRVYRSFTPGANPAMSHWITSSNKTQTPRSRSMLADMDADGTPEIVIDNEVFIFDFSDPANAKLRKVLDGGNNNPSGKIPVFDLASPAVADLLTPTDCNGDPDCNGLEIAAGPVIYSIDLDSLDGDGLQIKIQRDLNFMESPDLFTDGYTAVADMDIDGIPDIVVVGNGTVGLDPIATGIYVWNKNGLRRFMNLPIQNNVWELYFSLPMIANVFDDTKRGLTKDFPEIVLSTYTNLYCYNLHATNFPDLSAWWFQPLSNQNGSNHGSATAFDFNGDGLSEIVFCDNQKLRIIYGGHFPFPPGVDANRNWATTPFIKDGGLTRYPVIADVDDDGQAEIIQMGKLSDTSPDLNLPLFYVYESADLPWPACRSVWNQYNYNVVNVEDDLGIPIQPQQQWKEFPVPGSGKRPLNMILGQLGSLDGTVPIPLANLGSEVDTFYCDKDSLRLRLRVCNSGSVSAPAGLSLQWYQGNPTTVSAVPFNTPNLFPLVISKDSCAFWNLALPLPSNGDLFGIINDDGSLSGPIDLAVDFPSTPLMECDYLDNLFSIEVSYNAPTLDLGPDQLVCKETDVMLTANPGFSRYRWQDGTTNANYTATNLGTYWVDAWDICGNLFSDTLRLLAIPTPALALGPDLSICLGDSVALTTTGFDLVDWISGGSTLCTACPVFSLNPVTDMSIQVRAQSGICIDHDTISISVLPLPQISGQAVETHCGNADGSINILINSGLPYQIQWSGGQTGPTLSGLAAATYTVTVTDDAGCSQTKDYTVATSTALALNPAVLTNLLCFGDQNGSISVSTNAGMPPYQYNWSTGQGSNPLQNLVAGNYALTLTDANGCTASDQYTLTEPMPLKLLSTLDSTSCSSTTADIYLDPQGGTSPYNFDWNSGQNTPVLSDVPPGIYSVTVHDFNGCETIETFDIQAVGAPIISDSLLVPVPCAGDSTGQITVVASLGLAPYQYNWSTGADTESLQNLAAGTYLVTVTDANGCTATEQFSLGQPDAISIFADIDSISCTSSTGSISINALGGTASFAFNWSNGQITPVINNLNPGTYTVTISDENGCTLTQSFTIAPGGAPVLSDSEVIPVTCSGEANGQISVEVNGGVPPYQFQWSNGSIDHLVGNLPPGDYSFTASGANGCLMTVWFTLTEPDALTLSATVDSTSCTSSTGKISVAPQGGTFPYNYLWNDGQTVALLNDLPPGSYSVTTTDSNGCTTSEAYSILPGGAPELAGSTVIPVTCFGENNGQIRVQITGGGPPYQLNWSNGQESDVLNMLSAGSYQVTITDENACTTVAVFSVETPVALEASLITDADTCGQSTGAISVNMSGGIAPYTYLWSDGPIQINRSDISAGAFQLTVTDANGCSFMEETEVISVDILPVFSVVGDTINCVQTAITVIPSPAPASWIFDWQLPDGTFLAGAHQTFHQAGQYTLTAVNEFGCTSAQSIDIVVDSLRPLAKVISDHLHIPCDQSSVILDGSGSSMGADFAAHWYQQNNGQMVWDTLAHVAQTGANGTFILQITNLKNGCTDYDTVQVTVAAPITGVVIGLDSISCFGLEDGSIQVDSVTGGLAPYTYSLDNQSFSSNYTFADLPKGSYVLMVRDANGCDWESEPLVILEPAQLSLHLSASDTHIEQGEAVVLTAQIQPVDAVLSQIFWSPSAYFSLPVSLTETVQPAETTLFQIEVEDDNGCTVSDTARVWVRREAVYVPNVFQPGSLDNDQFTVFAGADILEVRVLQVYDRWGEQLFENRHFPPNDPGQGWDGTYRGNPVSPGVYIYYLVVETLDGRAIALKGSVTIVR